MGHDASMSLYDYCNGDPVNGCDPTGRDPGEDAAFFTWDDSTQQAYLQGKAKMAPYVAPLGIIGASYLLGPEVGIPTTAAGLRLIGLGAAGAGIAGFGGTGIGDTINSLRLGQISISSPQTYAANTLGNAVGGGLGVYTLNPYLGASTGSYLSASLDGAMNGNYNPNKVLFDTGLGTAIGAGAEYFGEYIIPEMDGVNSGRNSLEAIYNQIMTKTQNGTIGDFTGQTTMNIFTYQLATTTSRDALVGATGSVLDSYFYGDGNNSHSISTPSGDPLSNQVSKWK